MGPAFDLYVSRASWLHRLDPRTKLFFVVLATMLVVSFQHVLFLVGCLVAWHLVLWSGRIPASRLRWVWERMLPISVLIFTLWPLFDPQGQPVLLEIWRIRITGESVLRGLVTALRVDALAFAFFVWLFTTDQASLVRGFVKLGLPYPWGLTLTIALRYIPTFYGLYVSVLEAQQARGWIIQQGNFITRARSYLPILVAVIISALRMTDHLAMALAARGLGARPQRTVYKDIRWGWRDVWCLAGMAIITGVLLGLRWRYGWGASPW